MSKVNVAIMGNDTLHSRLFVVVSVWDPFEMLAVSYQELPVEVLQAINDGAHFVRADVNLDAVEARDIVFSNWELFNG